MKTSTNIYYASSITDALSAMQESKGNFAVLAGGTDLLLDIDQGRHPAVDSLVDVSDVTAMNLIELRNSFIYLGAAVTHKSILSNQLLQENAQCVVEGCGLIGGPQVRNVATIGGNVAHALPAGDGTISLLALDTEVEIAASQGERWEPLVDIFSGPGKVTFDRKNELVTRFRFRKRGEREGSAFHRIMRPQGVAIAILNMAAWVSLDQDGHLADVRISCGPAGPRPFRAYQTEAFLKGKRFDESAQNEAVQILGGEVNLRTSKHRATKEYRHHLLPVLLKQVLSLSIARANKPRD